MAALGFEQVTGLTAAKTLTVPAGARRAVVVCTGQAVRWRDDGTSPTATIGMLIPTNTEKHFAEALGALEFIESAATAVLNVSYYS